MQKVKGGFTRSPGGGCEESLGVEESERSALGSRFRGDDSSRAWRSEHSTLGPRFRGDDGTGVDESEHSALGPRFRGDDEDYLGSRTVTRSVTWSIFSRE